MATVFLWIGLGLTGCALAFLLYQDWQFISRRWVRVEAEVIRHDASFSDGDEGYKAVFAFTDSEGTRREVLDLVAYSIARPPIGTRVTITHPLGLPGKARVSHPVIRAMVYLTVALMVVAMGGRLAGWIAS